MIGAWISWWVAASLLGALAFPLSYRIFSRLPDRGLVFSRLVGLLLASYGLWMGASLGLLRNTLGGALASLIVLLAASWLAGRGRWGELRAWLRSRLRLLLASELILLVCYGVWAFVRANNPEIQHTEKPMELAFINGILRSESFPPKDPWLSGYAISYYYFGYVMLSLLIRLTGVASGVAFNLGNALWFGLVAAAAYSVLYNLLSLRGRKTGLAIPLLAPAYVLISGNLEAFLEVLHSRHLFWRALTDGNLVSGFWRWLDLKDLSNAPVADPSWIPSRFLWWWRASRVVRDVNLAGVDLEVIDEFPFFSFLLADNHPHLLAMPFALLAIGLAIQLFLGGTRSKLRLRASPPQPVDLWRIGRIIAAGAFTLIIARALIAFLGTGSPDLPGALSASEIVLRALRELILAGAGLALMGALCLILLGVVPVALNPPELLFSAWLFGGLAFLNTWDTLIYLSLALAVLLWQTRHEPAWEALKLVAATGLAVGLGAVLLYLPWYPTFASQAAGILPNLIFPTRFPQFLIMFGVPLTPIIAWLIRRAARNWSRSDGSTLAWMGPGLPLGLLVLSLLLAGFIALVVASNPLELQGALNDMGISELPLQDGLGELSRAVVSRRMAHSWTALALGLLIALGYLLLRRAGGVEAPADKVSADRQEAWPFVVMLIGVGALLVLAPEFVYLRDLFGTRMNTVFKFYFGAWILWGLAGAYAMAELWPALGSIRAAAGGLLLIPLALGMIYPALATWTKTNGFEPPLGRTLNGAAYLQQMDPSEYQAILWSNLLLPDGVVAEAVGGSYTQFGRVSAHTGLATVLGWDFHELQWRGSAETQGSRRADIQLLYESPEWSSVVPVLDRYGIDYVFVGSLETASYQPLNLRKFDQYMNLLYQNDDVRIYGRKATTLR